MPHLVKSGFLLSLLVPTLGYSEPTEAIYRVKTIEEGSVVDFSIGYSLGRHDGSAFSVDGFLKIESNELGDILSGSFAVPVDSMITGNEKRDCHLVEAMGMNYETSSYPGKHICDSNNELPAVGLDSVSFPEVVFNIVDQDVGTLMADLGNSDIVSKEVLGMWTIHGVSLEMPVVLNFSKAEDGFTVLSQFDLSLESFLVKVIPWAGLIKVKDTATVKLNLGFTSLPVEEPTPVDGDTTQLKLVP